MGVRRSFAGLSRRGRPDRAGWRAGESRPGWVGFDFAAAFGRAVRVANDAAMQALGGYNGGRMLFLGLGTGLGSALVADRVLIPLELGDLPVGPDEMLSDSIGKRGLDRLGEAAWKDAVLQTVIRLRKAFAVDSVLVGGGNAQRLDTLPEGIRLGHNDDALRGGIRLWEEYVAPHDPSRSTPGALSGDNRIPCTTWHLLLTLTAPWRITVRSTVPRSRRSTAFVPRGVAW